MTVPRFCGQRFLAAPSSTTRVAKVPRFDIPSRAVLDKDVAKETPDDPQGDGVRRPSDRR